MFCSIEMNDVPTVMAEYDEHIEHSKGGSGDSQEIHSRQAVRMICEKRSPGLRRRYSPMLYIFGDCSLGYVNPELEQFSVNSGGPHSDAPQPMLVACISRISLRRAGPIAGRPGLELGSRLFQRQY